MQEGRVTVLVIEDDGEQRRLLRDVLEEHGCVVLEAMNGTDGVRVYVDNPCVDVLVCDFSMPGLDGGRVHRVVRGLLEARGTRFLLVSGGCCDVELVEDFIRVSTAPGVEFVEKPYDISLLCEKIAGRKYPDPL